MNRTFRIALWSIMALSLAGPPATAGETSGMVGVGVGIAQQTGTVVPVGLSGAQLLTVSGTGAFFASSWVVVAADFSIGLNTKNQRKDNEGDTFTAEFSAWYVDGLVGANKTFGDGGFLYLAAGLVVAGGKTDFEMFNAQDGSVDRSKLDAGTAAGLALGVGAGIPISGRLLGYVNYRHRFVTSEVEITAEGSTDVEKLDYNLGGPEMSVGIGVGF